MTIDDAETKHDEFNSMLAVLSNYFPKAQKYIEAKNNLLDNAKKLLWGDKKVIEGFKEGIFPLKYDDEFEKQQTSKKFNETEPLKKPTKIDVNKLNKLIIKEETDIDRELF